ncbi:MAG: hypothetical protein GY845_23635 [Planctomycetes bacterium]|nr:hypothetical protein [Planctomycetota bacterium]
MNKKLIVISTCSNKKRYPPDESCTLDFCRRQSCSATIEEWIKTTNNPQWTRYTARRLYKGAHWKETLACTKVANERGFAPELWILSAGWGLISSNDNISSYSATFASGKNSIHNLPWPREYTIRDRSRKWWQEINRKQKNKEVHSLSELPFLFEAEKLCFLMIMSKDYYLAIEPEVIKLISQGIEVIIVSAGLYTDINRASPLVRDHILPFNDKYTQIDPYLKQANTSLNARLAKWLIKEHYKELRQGLSVLYKVISKIERELPAIKRRKVRRLTDEEVIEFINENYIPNSSTATKLLKRLRHKEKKSCEQKRFGALFKKYERNCTKGGLFDV